MKGPTGLDQWQEAQITTSCTRIGNWVEDAYQKDVDCQESLKELLRYLRRDNDYFSVRRLLGEYEIIQRHLIPLLISCGDDKGIFNFALRLLVNLTTPPLLLWREEIPADKESRTVYLQLKSHQSAFKDAFSSVSFWETVSRHLQELLNLDWESRQEDDKIQLEMILILVRNTLHIPPSAEDLRRTDDDASSHDHVIWALHESGLNNLLLYIASSDSEHHLCMHILEIVSRMLRDSNPEDLATTGKPMSATRREESTKSLVQQKIAEEKTKAQRAAKLSTRHSRFGGIYSVRGVKSIGERDATVTKPVFDPDVLAQDHLKVKKRNYGRTVKMQEQERPRKSTLAIRLILRDFALEFLNSAYNTLMHVVKDNIMRHRTMANDESYYLWAMRFFMEFSRLYSFKLELVSETMSVDSFHYVQSCIESYISNIMMDKRNLNTWNQRIQKAMGAYKELLLSLVAMDKSKTEADLQLSQHIKSHIFYQMEYRELCLQLLQHFSESKLSRSFLRDLVESCHIFFKLLENFANKNRHIVIQKKKKKTKRKSKKQTKGKKQPEKLSEEQVEELWPKVKSELEKGLNGEIEVPDDVMPFDPASDESMDDQKRIAVRRIHRLMRDEKASEAVALFRASRGVWPEGDVFAAASSSPEEELDVLKEMFFFEFPDEVIEQQEEEEEHNELIDDGGGTASEEDEETSMPAIVEQEFDFKQYQMRLCSPKIVHALNLQLSSYEKETTFTNHATVKLMHRIAWDCNHPAMFFQATLFRTFQRALNNYKSKVDPALKEISQFAHFILRKLAEVSKTNNTVFVELLFPKTNREAVEIEHGYGTYKSQGSSVKSAAWAEEEEFELEQLYDEFKDKEGDVIEMICNAMISQTRSRRQVVKKLKSMGVDVKELKKRSKGHIRPRKEWSENEIIELRDLVSKFLDSHDPLGRIVEHLTVKRPKHRVKQKILDLGFVSDPKDLRKKRVAKPKNSKRKKADAFDQFIDEEEVTAEQSRLSGPEDGSQESGSDSNSSDSDSDDDLPLRPKFIPHMLKKSSRANMKKVEAPMSSQREPTTPFDLERCKNVLTTVDEKGLQAGLAWLLESLEEIVTDREVDEMNGIHESVPLVPISEDAIAAVEDETFLELLTALSLSKPLIGQEQYWRVPGSLTNADLQLRCQLISAAISRGTESENSNDGARNNPSEEAELEERPKRSPRRSKSDDSDSDIEFKEVRKRARIESDSE